MVFAGALAMLAACAPGGRAAGPAPDGYETPVAAVASDTLRRWLRPVPTTSAYRAALAEGTRSATGAPGPRYWQSSVSYRIQAELDPATAELRGSERVVWRNRSRDTLSSIVLNLYQNVFTETARRNRVAQNTGGVTLTRVAAQGTALAAQPTSRIRVAANPAANAPVGYAVDGTLARLVLPRAVTPGDSVVLEIDWHHRVPPAGTFRTAYEDALGARAFNVAQWYPQVATYDDVNGWDATPYLGDGEFYLEYGDFDVSITLPAGQIVGATGTLANAGDVLSAQTRERLDRAARSDSVVRVVTAADLDAGTATARRTGSLTWRFVARDVRDFAFATSDRYLWDAARASGAGSGAAPRPVVVNAYYRPGAPGWDRAWRYGQHSIEFFSRELIPYIYPQVTIAEGPIGGMEYPMLVFIPRAGSATSLHAVIAHEVGHEWFPMMIGQDEAAYAWMDEGLTSYGEDRAARAFFPEEEDPRLGTQQSYLNVAGRDNEVPLMRHTDLVSPYGARTVAAYTKPAAMLVALRAVLGDAVFDRAMRTYANEWLLKHPTPWDFFATFERVSGRDLDWFFYPAWFETGVLDQAIVAVEPVEGGVNVVVRDLGDLPMPTTVAVTTEGGTMVESDIPLETWTREGRRTATVALPTSGRVTRVEIDPRRLFPDADRSNNVWTPAGNP
ncbi:MAG TPA: M1 family metallopeptidase [Longimicrobium sp.]|nr:M1 family metallopeptidase [Longimicrobium sp.]